jgi:hypothetical protein
VSARHQVKRLDRTSNKAFAPIEAGPAEENFLRTVRMAFHPQCHRHFSSVRFDPDVFADALVPGWSWLRSPSHFSGHPWSIHGGRLVRAKRQAR